MSSSCDPLREKKVGVFGGVPVPNAGERTVCGGGKQPLDRLVSRRVRQQFGLKNPGGTSRGPPFDAHAPQERNDDYGKNDEDEEGRDQRRGALIGSPKEERGRMKWAERNRR